VQMSGWHVSLQTKKLIKMDSYSAGLSAPVQTAGK
jgi:hypothetical protein